MLKRSAAVVALVCLLSWGGEASAELCTVDGVPAATLLLPYFEVNLDVAWNTGINTLFSINNASSAPTIAHVSIWSDWSQPVLDFDIYLSGYDVQTVSMYEVLVRGNLPVTADLQSDQGQDNGRINDPTSSCSASADSCSPNGGHPAWDASFTGAGIPAAGVADCIDIFPFFVNPLLNGARLADIQAKLTGQPVGGGCFGADHGDGHARGYITIDNANACSLIFPNDPGYFSDGVNAGIASNVNQLWGDWFFVDPQNAFAQGDTLVHIEADDAFTGGANDYTFYRRYTGPINPSEDNREPLATAWGMRYINGGLFDGGTSLVVWRDATVTDIDAAGHVCGAAGATGTGPGWHPLNETQVVAFNEAESAEELCGFFQQGDIISPPDINTFDPTCFPLETQRVPLGADPLALTYSFGWMYLNLNVGADMPTAGVDYDPAGAETLSQSYVAAAHDALGVFSVGYPAIQVSSACSNDDPTIMP